MWVLTSFGQRINTDKIPIYYVAEQQETAVWQLIAIVQEMDQPVMLAASASREEIEAVARWLDEVLRVVTVGE